MPFWCACFLSVFGVLFLGVCFLFCFCVFYFVFVFLCVLFVCFVCFVFGVLPSGRFVCAAVNTTGIELRTWFVDILLFNEMFVYTVDMVLCFALSFLSLLLIEFSG